MPKLRPRSITEVLVKARKTIGTIAVTGRAETDYGDNFTFLSAEDIATHGRPVFDDLGILVLPHLIPETYRSEAVGNLNYLQFRTTGVYNVEFRWYNPDLQKDETVAVTVSTAAVDDRDKDAAKLNTLAEREAMKLVLMALDGRNSNNIEDDTRRIEKQHWIRNGWNSEQEATEAYNWLKEGISKLRDSIERSELVLWEAIYTEFKRAGIFGSKKGSPHLNKLLPANMITTRSFERSKRLIDDLSSSDEPFDVVSDNAITRAQQALDKATTTDDSGDTETTQTQQAEKPNHTQEDE